MSGIEAISGLTDIFSSSKKTANNSGDFAAVLAKTQAAQDASATAAAPDELLSAYKKNLHDFRNRVEELLQRLGIDTNGQPLQIQLNLLQQLSVSGDHPQLAEAQSALQHDPQLTSLFTILQQQAAQLAGRQNQDANQQASLPFALQIDGGQITQVKS
jgi:vacuolar-type H+-ATPase subunit E/Vma4